MDNKNRNLTFLVLCLSVLTVMIFIYSRPLGAIALLLSVFAFFQVYEGTAKIKEEYNEEVSKLDKYFDDISRAAVFSLPFPISIVNQEGNILWHNTQFADLYGTGKLKGHSIDELLDGINLPVILEEPKGYINTVVGDKHYSFFHNKVEVFNQEDENIVIFYGFDRSEYETLKREKFDDKLVLMVIEIDNYDEIRSVTEEEIRPVVLGEIDKKVNTFASQYNGFARKFENDKYLLVFDRRGYEEIKEDKFPLVEELENIEELSEMKATMSAGVGASQGSPLEIYKIARLALDIAQGRGGDQIVENDGENLNYYGGKKGAVDKRTKVKSRIISNATVQLIDQLQDVYIMGHKNPDMDSFGSCLGMYALVKSRGAKAKILLDKVTPQISSLYDQAITSIEGLADDIVKPKDAYDSASENSLVILLDNHSALTAEGPELLDITDNLILIDHHRRQESYVQAPTLTYLEPYASSTSELVTEIIQYTDDIRLDKTTAEGLLAGIKVDTKSFTYQTGVRTFDAASFLQKEGADAVNVNSLFNEPSDIVKSVAEVVAQTEIYRDITAIASFETVNEGSILIAAKAADQMIQIKGVKASFVLSQLEDYIHVSGRSSGHISVQIIMERMGGGGHQTAAACQLTDVNMEEARQMLKDEIDKYLEEEEE